MRLKFYAAAIAAAMAFSTTQAGFTFTSFQRTCSASLGDDSGGLSQSFDFGPGTGERETTLTLDWGVNTFPVWHWSNLAEESIFWCGTVPTFIQSYANGAYHYGFSGLTASFSVNNDQAYESGWPADLRRADGSVFKMTTSGILPAGTYEVNVGTGYGFSCFNITLIPAPSSALFVPMLISCGIRGRRNRDWCC
jgi:hypothetical protein